MHNGSITIETADEGLAMIAERLRLACEKARQIRHGLAQHKKTTRDAGGVVLVAAIVFVLADWSELADWTFRYVADHPEYEITDFFALALALGAGSVWFSIRRFRDLRHEVTARQQAEQSEKNSMSGAG